MLSKGVLKPDWPHLSQKVGALTTLRTAGISLAPFDDGHGSGGFNLGSHVGDRVDHVLFNRNLLAQFLPNQPQWLTQVHGITVLNFDKKQNSLIADACITTQPNVVCSVLTADCLPVLFCDAQHSVVGAAHAGWRGLADGVLENTIFAMQKAGADPEKIQAWFGPAIGPLKFEVGQEVREQFIEKDLCANAAFKLAKPGQSQCVRFYADIVQLARLRLKKVGVHQFSGGNYCTVSEPEKFYSYRRDGVTGRMASLIWLNPVT